MPGQREGFIEVAETDLDGDLLSRFELTRPRGRKRRPR
jgi:hypothetical protein